MTDTFDYSKKFEYSLEKDEKSWRIEWKGNFENFPPYVFKYFALSSRTVNSLEKCELFASLPEKMNDLFDATFHTLPIAESDLSSLMEMFPQTESIDIDEFVNSESYRIEIRNTLYALFNQIFGIISTTDDCLNDLMWSHYAKNDGFCIKYNYKLFPSHFGSPIPVSYLRKQDFLEINEDKMLERFIFNWLRKKHVWFYEKELRFLITPPNGGSFITKGAFSNVEHNFPNSVSRTQSCSLETIEEIVLGFHFIVPVLKNSNTLNFNFKSGRLRLRLVEFAMKNNIPLSIIVINPRNRVFEKRPFRLKQLSKRVFEYEIINS